jgi:dCTP deaminase
MTVLSGRTIWELGQQGYLLSPMEQRTQIEISGKTASYGLSMCGYDIRLDQDITLWSGRSVLASSLERFCMPLDVVGVVHDKSTWAREGISVQNTVIEPGWRGFLTLEILYSPLLRQGESPTGGRRGYYELDSGTPIAQVIFHRVDVATDGYGGSKYQDQERGPVGAR